MNPNVQQAAEDETAGEEELGEDIDYDAVYGGLDIEAPDTAKSPALEKSYSQVFGENAKDFAKQYTKETLIGIGGAYGDLTELAGINQKEGTPGQQARSKTEFELLQKMEQPGYKPNFSDIYGVSGDEDIAPTGFRLPSSEDLRGVNEALGGPGEPETPGGRYGGRIGRLHGQGIAFGQVNPIPAVAAGIAGEGVADLGGGPLAQAAAEIVTLIVTQGRGGRPVSSHNEEVQQVINDLRNLGYTEEDITLAINAAYANSKKVRKASKGAATEEAFENFAEHSDEMVSDILQAEIPGIEHGTQHVHQMASDAYGAVAQQAANLTITNPTPFLNSARRVVDNLTNTLGTNPEALPFIRRLSEAAMHSTQYPTAEAMMNFYKELNSMGKWLGRNQRDRLINQVKDGIRDTFRNEGRAGRQLAERFEEVNAGVRRAFRAEELHDIIQRTVTQEGIDYAKFYKIFNNPENVHLMQEVLGNTATRNLNTIAREGRNVKNFDKAWRGANNLSEASKFGFMYYIFKGDWAGVAKVAGAKIGLGAAAKLRERSLTDPRFQNIVIKGLHALGRNTPRSMLSAKEEMRKYLEEQGIDVDLAD